MRTSLLHTALLLGLLSAIGPIAIDMYLPALPSIGQSLGASPKAVQASLMAFFMAIGIGQIIYGPVSDMMGRKPPLYFGLTLFSAGSIGCALAPDIYTLVALRFIQGLGACASMVIPRAVIRDLYIGNEAVRLMSRLMLVFSVSPILAPLAGSLLIGWAGWRSVFWAVTLFAVLVLFVVSTRLSETRPPSKRVGSNLRSAFKAYGTLLKDDKFLRFVFIGAFGISSFFVYLANSSFVLIEHYGLTPRQYSIAFSVNAAAFIGISQLTDFFGKRFGLVPMLKMAINGYAAVMTLLFLLNILGIDRLGLLIILLFIGYGFLGLITPVTAVLALEEQGAIAGTASALMGTIYFVTGSAVMAAVGLFVDGTAKPMITGIMACSIVALILARGSLGVQTPPLAGPCH